MPPTLASQLRNPVLTVTSGLRLAYVGGTTFDTIKVFGSISEAQAARQAALAATDRLARIFRGREAA